MNSPPQAIDNAAILWWAPLDGLAKTNACTFHRDGAIQEHFAGLAIAQYAGASNCCLFLCDQTWGTQNDTDHDSIDEAKAFAESLYPGVHSRWRPAAT